MPTPQIQLVTGNQMCARGAVAAGCRFFAGYPITPSSEIYSEMMKRLPPLGGVAVGTPDEISALSYAVGSSMMNSRAMTATSGPGWSLMVETAQYAVMTETPVVIVIVQRLGPATGGATQGAQGDVLFVEYATSGGYPIPVLAPVDAMDCYTLTAEAFRIADELRTPVIRVSDKEVGTTTESLDVTKLPAVRIPPRALAGLDKPFVAYGIERLEDVPAFAPVGGKLKVTITGSAHNQRGELRKNDPETIRQLEHLEAKITSRAESLERVRHVWHEGAKTLLLSYGISARTCRQVVKEAQAEGRPVDLLEVLSLFPVPQSAIRTALEEKERVVIVEENRTGLYARELSGLLKGCDVRQVNQIGAIISPAMIRKAVLS
jgi:2-oxoglutarate/2-oxoacid ferredoxin oxidoreductase subunit alpha